MNGESRSSSVPSNVKGICPRGWHIPSDGEWKILELALGMPTNEIDFSGYRGSNPGTQIKSTSDWINVNGVHINGSNSSGFNAYPVGWVESNGTFLGEGRVGAFWCTTTTFPPYATYRLLTSGSEKIGKYNTAGIKQVSCRCVED